MTSIEVPKLKMNNGLEIPMLALGTFPGVDEKVEVKPCRNDEMVHAVEWAIETGYRHIDTAPVYHTEDQVGRGIRRKIADGTVTRDEMFVTTKLWNNKPRIHEVVPALKYSLRKLNLDYVDLFLIHWPMAVLDDTEQVCTYHYKDTWKGLEEAVDLGLAKSIGVSNFSKQQLHDILRNCRIKPSVLQVEVNLNWNNSELVTFARSAGLIVMASAPLGLLAAEKMSPVSSSPSIFNSILMDISKKYGKTTPQIALRFLVQKGLVPIPKSQTKSRIQENVRVFDFSLTQNEMETLDTSQTGQRTYAPLFWLDHPYYPFDTDVDFKFKIPVPKFMKNVYGDE